MTHLVQFPIAQRVLEQQGELGVVVAAAAGNALVPRVSRACREQGLGTREAPGQAAERELLLQQARVEALQPRLLGGDGAPQRRKLRDLLLLVHERLAAVLELDLNTVLLARVHHCAIGENRVKVPFPFCFCF